MAITLRPTLVKQVPYQIEDVFQALSTVLPQMDGYKVEEIQPITNSFRVKTKSTFTRSGATIRIALSKKERNIDIEMVATPNVPTQMFDIGDSMTKSMETIFKHLSIELEKYQVIEEEKQENLKSVDITQQIRDLAKLVNEGLLTEEEFALKKKQLLNI